MGINDNYVKALTKMASDPKNQEAYRQRVATIQADMQRVREQEVLADFNQWKADNGVVDVPQPKAPVMKSVDELRKPTQTREYNKKLANDQRIKETLARKQKNVAPYRKNYGNINVSKRERQQNKDGSYSTILGASNAFAGNNGEYEVSYSPFLQTGTGTPEKLDDSTMQTYINSVLREAEKKPGGATEKNILAVDKQGYNVNGKQISGMIAGAAKYGANGENDPNVQRVIRSAEEMHYAGEYYDKLADSAKAKDIVMKQNKGRDEYVRRQQVKEATMKQNKGRDEYILNQQKLEAATPVTTPEQTKYSPVSNYLTGNSTPNNSFYNNTGVSVSRTADKKAKVQPNKVETGIGKAQDAVIGAGEKVVNNPGHFFEELLNLPDTIMRVTNGLYDPKNATTAESIVAGATNALGNTTGDIATIGAKAANKVVDNDLTRSAVNEVARQRQALAEEAQNVAEDHPYAFGTGALAESLAENAALYGLANKALKGTKLAGGVERLAKRLPGGNVASDFYTDVMLGQLADTAIDTPRTIAGNAVDGKYIDENGNVDMGKVLADIGINQAVNLGFNAAFGAGELRRGIKSYPARRAAEQAEKDARDIAFHDLLNATNRNTPEAVAREEADLLTQARQYGKARKIAEANNAKVQLQTPEATAKEEAELLAQARAMGEERAKASKQFEKVKESVLKDFDPNSNRSWQKTINKLSEYRKKYGDSANEDIMSFARDLESYSKGIEGTEVEKVLGPRRTVNVTERPRRFNGDMRTSEDFARNSTYIAEPLQREGMREAIGEDLYNRLEKSYVNWMDEYFRMDKTAGAANELELRAKYLEDTLDDVAKVTGDDFSNIKNAIRQNNELAIADNYGTTKFVTDYKGDHAGTKAKEPGYQFSDLTEEESELVDRSLRSARSAVGELDNRVREIQNRYNDWTKSGYGGDTYKPVSDTLAAQLDELKSSYNIYADAIADPAHEGLGYAKRALIRDLEKTRKLVNEEGKFNVNFGKQLTMDINGAEKAIYGHKVGDLPSYGYHAGDLGKAESLGNQSGNRSTGHFGTGTYFVGDEAKLNTGGYKDRPRESVDFSNYNLYKPKDETQGKELHEFLKGINENYNSADDAIKSVDEWNQLKEDVQYRAWNEVGEPEEIKGQLERLYGTDAVEDYVERYPKESMYEIADRMTSNATGVDDSNILRRIGRVEDYEADFDKKVQSLFGISGDEARQMIHEIRDEINSANYDLKGRYAADSASTRFMKRLGYEGVDVRNLKNMDNVEYGSVIYDLKGNDLARQQANFKKNSVDNERKLAHNEGIKEKTDYGNGGIIKETGTEETVRRSGLQNNETLGNDSGAYGRDSVGPEGAEIYPGLPRGRRQGSGDSTVSTGVVVRDNVRKAMDEQGVSNMGLKDSSGNYSRYSEALSSARKANEYGAFVDSKTVDELTERGAKAYLNDEGTAGVAVMNDGNIVGVFKHPRDTRKGASTDLIITARENGGDRLDCYGAKLVRKYSEGGFEPVARVKYEYGINPEMDSYMKLKKSEKPNFKEPEIYFMKVRDGESVEDSLKALSNGSSPVYTPKQLSELPLMDYEAAEAYRDSLIEQAKQSSANNTAFSMRKNNADKLATDVKSFADRTELKKPSTVAETKEPIPTLTAKPQKEEKPFRDALESRLTKDGEIERSYAMNTRVGKVEGIPKEVQQQFIDSPEMYKQLRNADTVANATKAREEAGDIGNAYNTFRSMLKEKNPEAVVMGHQLAKEYSAMGDYDMASTVIRETAEELTKAGQFTQAAAISMMKNDPMTARAYLEKEIDALNRGAKERFGDGFENFKLTKEEKEMFNDIKPGDAKALKEAYDKVGARLGREYPTTLWQKVVEGRHLAMLFNPRTHIRNTVANVLLLPQRTVSNRVNAVLEKGMSAINKDFDVSQSLKGGSKQQKEVGNYLYKTEIANALENAQKYVEDIGGKSGSKLSDYAKDADVFKGSALSHWINKKTGGKLAESVEKMGGNGAESMLELLRRMDYKALDVEDQIFVKRNFVDRLASYMDAKGIKPSEEVLDAMKTGNNKEVVDQFLAEIPPEGISIALDEALKATFKDDNAFTKMLVNLKKDIGPAGELIMPFTKTPANLAVRAYDYSPAGAVHGIVKAVKSKDVQGIRNGLDRLSKGLTGTGMLAAGYALRQSGLITGGYDKDKDKKQQQIKEGYKPYAIHLGDKYYTYDWAEPASSSLVMASEIYDAMNDGSKQTNIATAGAKAIQTGVDTWVNSSPLSSFADLMGSGSVSSSVGQRAMETALNFPGSFVPAVVGATAKVSDTTQRNTYDPNNPVKSAMNQVVAKIPELSKTLPAKYDTWGNEIKRYESKGEAAFANYLNPGVYSREKHTPIDDAIEKLYDETGDNGVYPLTAEYKIKLDDGTEKKLSSKEQSEYQKTMGKASYKMVSDFLKSDNAKGLDSGEKVDVIRGMYSFSKALAQKEIAGKEISSSYSKAYAAYEKAGGGENGLKAVEKFYENKAILNKAGLENNEQNQAFINKGGVKAVKQESDMKAALKEAGLQNNEKNRELYKSGGEEALQQKSNRTEALKEYGYSNGTKAAAVYDEKGEEGLKVLTETKSKLESGNQTTSVKNAMNYLDKQSMSDEDKGYYLSQSMSNMGGKAKAYVDKGDYEGFYEYEQKRTDADGDKNGSLKKSEVTDYLDRQNMTASQKKFWFEQLGQKKWKNPYK